MNLIIHEFIAFFKMTNRIKKFSLLFATIAVASRFAGKDERVVAMAYDSRKNY